MNGTNKDCLPPDLHPNFITVTPAFVYPYFTAIHAKLYEREAKHALAV